MDFLGSMGLIGIVVAATLILGLLALAVRCMRKVEPGTVGVRTGLGGIKVTDSYIVVLPLLHKYDIMDISVKRLEINRRATDGLICKDNLRADITVAFYIRVDKGQAQEVAQAVGCDRASEIEQLRQLFEAKFSEALKTAGKQFNFTDLYTEREQFKQGILEVIGKDLNGYSLEDAAIDYLEQTPLASLDENNVLDSQGIKLITGITAEQAQASNQIQRNKEKEIKRQDVEAREAILELEKQQAEAEERQKREVASVTSREQAEAQKVAEEERLKSESARINTEQELGVAEENKQRQIIVAQKNRERTDAIETERVEKDRLLEVTERERIVTLAEIEKEKTIETEQKNIQEVIRQRVELEKTVVAEKERIKDTEAFAGADREKRVLVTKAEMQAEEALVKDIKAAEAQKQAAELQAQEDKYKLVLSAEAGKESAELKAEEVMVAADAEEKAAIKLASARKSEAEGISSMEAATGLAQAQVMTAKADAREKEGTAEATILERQLGSEAKGLIAKSDATRKQGEAEANVMQQKFEAEAKGITEKAEAMKIFDGVGRDHEEFKLRLNKEKDIELAEINVSKDVAEQQAIIVGEALKSANIDIVGGESVFFDKITRAITQGKAVDRLTHNSDVLTDIKETFFNGDPEYFKQKLSQWIDEFGISSDTVKNLSISALLGQMMVKTDDAGTMSVLKQAVKMAESSGLADKPAKSMLASPAAKGVKAKN